MKAALMFVVAATAVASADPGIALVHGDASDAIKPPADRVRLVGVDAAGKLVDHGALDPKLTIAKDRVAGLPAGKPVDLRSPGWKQAALVVVVVDASRKAKDVRAALAALDSTCVGFAVASGDRLGAVTTTPCPAFAVLPAATDVVQLSLLVTAAQATVSVSRVNESETLARDALGKKLVEARRSAFFAGDGCTDIAAGDQAAPPPSKTDEGRMTMHSTGRCDALLAFGDDTTMSDVVSTFRLVIASGFTSPRWVAASALPQILPPEKPDKRTEAIQRDPEVIAARKQLDEAKAAALATAKDSTKSVDDIKAATARAKAADQAYKDAKKRAAARLK